MILGGVGALALAGGPGKIGPPPSWQLKADGRLATCARAGDFVTFTLRGQSLPGATAFLKITGEGLMQIVPYIRSDRALPIVLRIQIPEKSSTPGDSTGHIFADQAYSVEVIGRTASGVSMTSNSVNVYVAK